MVFEMCIAAFGTYLPHHFYLVVDMIMLTMESTCRGCAIVENTKAKRLYQGTRDYSHADGNLGYLRSGNMYAVTFSNYLSHVGVGPDEGGLRVHTMLVFSINNEFDEYDDLILFLFSLLVNIIILVEGLRSTR